MSRRKHDADAGTDSFLDVLANLVGILVILVVITALRAAAPAAAPPAPPRVAEPAPAREPLIAPRPNVVYELAPPPPPATDLIAAAGAADRRAAALAARLREEAARSAALAAEGERVDAAAAALAARLEEARQATPFAEADAAAADAALAAARAERDRWELVLAENSAAAARPTAALEHTLLPVGRVVTGRELHFRLVGDGRGGATVRPVPVEELSGKIEADARAHRDRLLTRGEYEGVVGPVAGYEMRYRMEAEGDVMGRVRGGVSAGTRFGLSRWILESVDDLSAEPVPAALANGSEFRFALATAGSDATATFWVAPEAFAAYRELRAAARAAGLTVAARPLPADVPISGSPRGTRSVAQ